jgi:hypothetical protein
MELSPRLSDLRRPETKYSWVYLCLGLRVMVLRCRPWLSSRVSSFAGSTGCPSCTLTRSLHGCPRAGGDGSRNLLRRVGPPR